MQCIYHHKNLLLLHKSNVQSSENQSRKCTIICCWLLMKDYLFHPYLWLMWLNRNYLKSSSGAANQPMQLEAVPDINLGWPQRSFGWEVWRKNCYEQKLKGQEEAPDSSYGEEWGFIKSKQHFPAYLHPAIWKTPKGIKRSLKLLGRAGWDSQPVQIPTEGTCS